MPRAVQYEAFGAPDVLRVVEVDAVHPSEGQVRVAVRAAGLNPYDVKVRSGSIPLAGPRFPRGTGLEFAGVVDQVGVDARYADGSPVEPGDEVLGWHSASVREQLAAKATGLARKPAGLDWAVAGSIAVAVQTATSSLASVPVDAADTVLSNGTAGSVGIMHAQLAIERGARVVGTASGTNHVLLESVGVIPTTYGPGLAERVRVLVDGVTAAQDNHGSEGVEAALELGVAPERICAIAVDPAAHGIRGPAHLDRAIGELERVARAIADGRMRFPIDSTYSLDQVADAYTRLAGRHLSGKVVVLV